MEAGNADGLGRRSYDSYDDNELAALLKQGDSQAFQRIYQKYWEELYYFAYKIIPRKEPVLDVLQDVFTWLWGHRESLNVHRLRPYLFSAVKYKIANQIRTGKLRDRYIAAIPPCESAGNIVEEALELKELKERIEERSRKLPDKCRKIYYLSRKEHLSNKQISEYLGISVKTVENQLTIALRHLHASLKQWLFIIVLTLTCL